MIASRVAFQLPGRWIWVWVWGALLVVGLLGLAGALQWGRETHWKNMDEILRGLGTVLVSVGMIFFLKGISQLGGIILIFLALACFVAAMLAGKRDADGFDDQF
ncbi:MAG: hypothetical protein U0104_12710 [Gemmatimonadales bacterium]|nr:hypothetical protein [Gemmatimonadales bacterium]